MSNNEPLARGGMSKDGDLLEVAKGSAKLAPQDEKVLCSAACFCIATPNVSVDGKALKQNCVAQHLGELDKVMQGSSPYKPEVSYDMTKSPPAPIMDSQFGNDPHSWIPGWIRKYWSDDPEHPLFEPGEGMIRRPDVVIVKDPKQPPVQDNIRQIVEMKFPPDREDGRQMKAYAVIAGAENKVAELRTDSCDCDSNHQDYKVPTEQLQWAAFTASLILFALRKGKSPRPVWPKTVY